MRRKHLVKKLLTALASFAVLTVYSEWVFALPYMTTSEISVTGDVAVNGQPAMSSYTVVSGSTIVTGANSSAFISLGKTGRIELLADSSLVLTFSESSIGGQLVEGQLRVASPAGVATTITTPDATIIADPGQASNFALKIESSHTRVDTTKGIVTMREGSNEKQLVAGDTATSRNLDQSGSNSSRPAGSGHPHLPFWVFLVAGGVVATAILINASNKKDNSTIVVSPTR